MQDVGDLVPALEPGQGARDVRVVALAEDASLVAQALAGGGVLGPGLQQAQAIFSYSGLLRSLQESRAALAAQAGAAADHTLMSAIRRLTILIARLQW